MSEEEQPAKKPATSKTDWPPLIIGGLLLLSYFLVTSLIIQKGIPEGSSPFVTELVTTLRDAFMLFIMYLFGTNASSRRKTELLSRAEPVKE